MQLTEINTYVPPNAIQTEDKGGSNTTMQIETGLSRWMGHEPAEVFNVGLKAVQRKSFPAELRFHYMAGDCFLPQIVTQSCLVQGKCKTRYKDPH